MLLVVDGASGRSALLERDASGEPFSESSLIGWVQRAVLHAGLRCRRDRVHELP